MASVYEQQADQLAAVWAKNFVPSLWNWGQRRLQNYARSRGDYLAMREALVYALRHGHTTEQLRLRMLALKALGEECTIHALLLPEVPPGDVWTIRESDGATHPFLFDRGAIRPTIPTCELFRYAQGLFPASTAEALRVLVAEYGLERILYAIDSARIANVTLRTPYGLTAFFADADLRQQQEHFHRTGMAHSLVELHDTTDELNWL